MALKGKLKLVPIPSMLYDRSVENPDFSILYNGYEILKISKEFWSQVKEDKTWMTYNYLLHELRHLIYGTKSGN